MPMQNVLNNYHAAHRRREKTYFISNTIKLQPKYLQMAKIFAPILLNTHPQHYNTSLLYPHLDQYIQLHLNHFPHRIFYALITTSNPSIVVCNTNLTQIPRLDIDWTKTLLKRSIRLPNPPKRHIHIVHSYIQFLDIYQDIIKSKNSIHRELYNFIHQQHEPPTISIM